MIRVFIGYDPREIVAYHVLSHSIQLLSTTPVSITPIAKHQLAGVHNRPNDPLASTEFSITRFLTPYLCNYEGWGLYLDCDMLLLEDIGLLWALRDPDYAVQVVKHEHKPTEATKFLGQTQTAYERKNWSSLMLINASKCRALSTEYVEQAPGLDLHQFRWLEDNEIGSLPPEWNHLVGYDQPCDGIKNLHFTLGGPYFSDYADCEFAARWQMVKNSMLLAEQRAVQDDDQAASKLANL